MDFTLSEEESAIQEITDQILGDKATHERLRQLTRDGVHPDAEAWSALADAGVVGASLPERHGGAGLGFLATAVALERVGYHAAPVPLLASAVLGGAAIARFGTDDQQSRWLPGIADGTTVATAALSEVGAPVRSPATEVVVDSDGTRLHGVKILVAEGMTADLALVPARRPDGSTAVFVIGTDAAGLDRQPVTPTTGRPAAQYSLDGVAVDDTHVLGADAAHGDEVLHWISQRAATAMCMLMVGAAQAAIELAADYTRERQQFDRPIATFQAVTQRAGDSFIDTEAIRLTALQAAWRLDAGLPAAREVQIARYWAAEAGYRAVHAAVHVHGGVGVDRDYPLHRHFLLARELELQLGNAEEQLADLGAAIAAG